MDILYSNSSAENVKIIRNLMDEIDALKLTVKTQEDKRVYIVEKFGLTYICDPETDPLRFIYMKDDHAFSNYGCSPSDDVDWVEQEWHGLDLDNYEAKCGKPEKAEQELDALKQ